MDVSATLVSRPSRDASIPKRRVFGQSLGVVRVLVPSQAALDRLTKQIGDRKLAPIRK